MKVKKKRLNLTGPRDKTWTKNALKGRILARVKPTVLRTLRDQRLMDQQSVAKALGITEPTYGGIEVGKRPVKQAVAQKIAKFFNQPVKFIFSVTEKNKYVAVPLDPSV